jgi:hypothetical protein
MDPINLWLDPKEVRQLAEKLIRPVPQAQPSSTDLGFDHTFVGFVGPEILTEPSKIPAVKPQVTPARIELPTPTSTQQEEETMPSPKLSRPQPFRLVVQNPSTPAANPSQYPKRLQVFREWLTTQFQIPEVYIIDHEGTVIFDDSRYQRLHILVRNFAQGTKNTDNVRIRVSTNEILELIPCETLHGIVVLSTLVSKPLPQDQILKISDVLKQTISPD